MRLRYEVNHNMRRFLASEILIFAAQRSASRKETDIMSHTSSRLASWLRGKSIGQRLNIQARAAVILCVAMVVTSTGGSLVSLGIMKKDNEMAHGALTARSEEHTSELQSLMRISYAVFCLK